MATTRASRAVTWIDRRKRKLCPCPGPSRSGRRGADSQIRARSTAPSFTVGTRPPSEPASAAPGTRSVCTFVPAPLRSIEPRALLCGSTCLRDPSMSTSRLRRHHRTCSSRWQPGGACCVADGQQPGGACCVAGGQDSSVCKCSRRMLKLVGARYHSAHANLQLLTLTDDALQRHKPVSIEGLEDLGPVVRTRQERRSAPCNRGWVQVREAKLW